MRTWTSPWAPWRSREPHPAIDGLVVEAAEVEAATHVVIAVRTILLVEPGGVEHLLGEFVIAPLGIGDDAIAVRRFEGGVDALDLDESLDGLVEPTGAEQVNADMIERVQVVGIDGVGLAVSVEGFVEAAEFVEDEAHIEEPNAIVRIDVGSEADLVQGFGPLALLEELLGLFDAALGIAPVVHNAPNPGTG